MKPAVAVDTNAAIAANGKSPQASLSCVQACQTRLYLVRSRQRVLIDEGGLVLDEYRRHLSPRGQPGLGDAFFKWLWDNQANLQVCRRVSISPISDPLRAFAEFPDDPDLKGFDRSDQKFVAVVLASRQRAAILDATDTDWWSFREALLRHGIQVEFLCLELMTT